MENTVMKSNLIYTIMRPPILTKGKCLFDKPPMQTFLVLLTRSSPPTFVGEGCVTSTREATLWRDVCFYLRYLFFHEYRKSSIKPPLSNKPPPFSEEES